MAYVLNCDIEVNEFDLQSCYIQFWTISLGKDMNHLVSQLWIKYLRFYFSTMMALALNNL